MKGLLKFIGIILTVIMVIWDLAGILILPALFVIIGLLNAFPWQYYAITVGGYFGILAIGELLIRLIFKALDKKFTSFLERKLEKYFNKNETED